MLLWGRSNAVNFFCGYKLSCAIIVPFVSCTFSQISFLQLVPMEYRPSLKILYRLTANQQFFKVGLGKALQRCRWTDKWCRSWSDSSLKEHSDLGPHPLPPDMSLILIATKGCQLFCVDVKYNMYNVHEMEIYLWFYCTTSKNSQHPNNGRIKKIGVFTVTCRKKKSDFLTRKSQFFILALIYASPA